MVILDAMGDYDEDDDYDVDYDIFLIVILICHLHHHNVVISAITHIISRTNPQFGQITAYLRNELPNFVLSSLMGGFTAQKMIVGAIIGLPLISNFSYLECKGDGEPCIACSDCTPLCHYRHSRCQ